ncbi:MAG: LURP-one-related family protein, partial [Oscillospiraceae bacterium]|nr:LURP-one-related family protein [Oscillospiraceae bacterium]
MSQLYIRQKVFSWKDRFSVKDADGIDRYTAEGELWSLGKKLHVNNMAGEEVAYIQQKLLTFLPRFHVFDGGILVAEIRKEFTFFRPSYVIEGPDWQVSGSFLEHDYEITHHGMPIVSVHKVWLSWGDAYEIDIEDGQ